MSETSRHRATPTQTPTQAPMKAARSPRGTGPAPLVAMILALLLIAAGALLLWDAVVALGWVAGTPWVSDGIAALGALSPAVWMFAVLVVAALVGIWLLGVAVKPRPRRAMPLRGQTGVFVRYGDLERLARHRAEDTHGVESASAKVRGRRRLLVEGRATTGPDATAEVEQALREGMKPLLEALDPVPKLVVKVRPATS